MKSQEICADIGEELTRKARDALVAYINASDELGKLGQVAEKWVASNVAEGINAMSMARDTLNDKFNVVKQVLNVAETALYDQRKIKAASARNARLETKRIMKVFMGRGNLLPNWRSALHEAGLSVDVDDPMYDESQNFSKYTASVPACGADSDSHADNWACAKRYAPNDAGAYLHCATSLPNERVRHCQTPIKQKCAQVVHPELSTMYLDTGCDC